MAAGIQDSRHGSHSWATTSTANTNGYGATANPNPNSEPAPRQRYQLYAPSTSSSRPVSGSANTIPGLSYDTHGNSHSPLPPHNEVEMTREMLITVLDYFSQLLPQYFDWSVVQSIAASTSSTSKAPSIALAVPQPKIQGMRFVVHGGACMLLHPGLHSLSMQQQAISPGLPARTKTRDVDYILRGFIAEYGGNRIPDAAERLRDCIQATARRFNLGADWMNSDADIALPMAHDQEGRLFDPIYTASVNPQNIALHTIYRSSNGFLTLVSVTPFWAVSLKLVRYTKWDAGDICLLLRNGTLLSQTQWTPETLEGWLFTECWAMGYVNFDSVKKAQMRSRIEHAIQTLAQWTKRVGSGSSPQSRRSSSGELAAVALPAGHGPPVIPEGQLHVSQWGMENGGQSQARSKSKSKSRNASRAASRNNTPEPEIFIPPNFESDDDADEHERYAGLYDRGRPAGYSNNSRTQERSAQSSWAPPNHSHVHTIHDPVAQGPAAGGSTAAGPWNRQQTRAQASTSRAVDPYSMQILDEVIGGVPRGTGAQSHDSARGQNYAGIGSGFQPEIPGVTALGAAHLQQQQQQQRRRNEKQRKVERQRARGSKWRSMSETESDESNLESDDDDDNDKENRMRDQRQRNARADPAAAKAVQSGPWHHMYAAPAVGRSTSGQQSLYAQERVPEQQGFAAFSQGQDASGRQLGAGRKQDRAPPRSVPRAASSDNKRRPAPLDLDSPFIPPGQRVQGQPGGPLPIPAFSDPAQVAQWQFEQQQKNYQREREQQQILAEREQMFYQRRQFTQVPAAVQGQQPLHPHQQQQMQMHYQQQQPAYQQQHLQQQYHQQMQMQQMQRGIYR